MSVPEISRRHFPGLGWRTGQREENGGSQSVHVYRKTVTLEDVVPNVDTNGYAALMTVPAGDLVYGVGWVVTEAFDDGGGAQASIYPLDSGSPTTALNAVNIDLTSTGNLNAYGNFGSQDLGAPFQYTTTGGANPEAAFPTILDSTKPFVSTGTPVALVVGAWADDGNAGSVDVYLWTATPEEMP